VKTERKRIRRGGLERLASLLMSGIFVYGGYQSLREPGARTQKAEKLGLPPSDILVRANGLAMIMGGLALGLGWKPKLTATALAASLVPTTLAGHRFWEEEDPRSRSTQLTQFLKNLAILGGLLVLLSKRRSVRVPAVPDVPEDGQAARS
jgi:putative oxidoreductase